MTEERIASSEIGLCAKLSIGQPVHLVCSESCLPYRLATDVCDGAGLACRGDAVNL